MNRRNLGYQFETEFGRTLKERFPFVVKLPDTRSLRFKSKIIEQSSGKNFQELTGTKTPADFWTMSSGISTLWECKHTMQESLPFERIAEHQLRSLEAHAAEGGRSYLVIGHKNTHAYVISIEAWWKLYKLFKNQGRKSIPLAWIKKLSVQKLQRLTPSKLPEGEDKARYVEVSEWD